MTEHAGRVFDRVPKWDPRNMAFLLSSREHPESVVLYEKRRTRHWTVKTVLDQGSEGACVGYGSTHYCQSTPQSQPRSDGSFARSLYIEAQELDEWPGENYEGTSVLGGMKALKTEKRVSGYLWATSTDEMAKFIGYVSPVVIGVDWHENMMDVDAGGFVHATGATVGGHCVCVCGYDDKDKTFTIVNSWGASWGEGGYAKITEHDMELLIGNQGEVALPRKVRVRP